MVMNSTAKKKRMANYLQIRLELSGLNPDILSAVLFREGCLGIEEFSDDVWLVYFPETTAESRISRLVERLRELHPRFRPDQLLITRLPESDWNGEWRKYFRPLRAGKTVWVAPPWDVPRLTPGEILVIIDPQMAFGTGSHQSTRLVILAMEKYLRPGDTVLDVGTGSGILSILAKKIGARDVFGFDIEYDAIENAHHNLKLNRVSGIEFQVGDLSVVPNRKYDLILANISREVLLDMLPTLAEKLASGGRLILSGFLIDDREIMINAIPSGLQLLDELHLDEWLGLVLKK